MDSDSEGESKSHRSGSSDQSSVRSYSRSPVSDRSRSASPSAQSPVRPRSPSPASGPQSPDSPSSRPLSPKSSSRSPSPPTNHPERVRSPSPSHSFRSNSPKSPSGSTKSRSSSSLSRSRSNTPDRTGGAPRSPPGDYNNHNSRSRSPKSSSSSSKKSSPDRRSVNSEKSTSSRGSRAAHVNANLDDGHTSDSSESSDDSRRKNKNFGKAQDTQPEEISDGDMESDHEKLESPPAKKEPMSITHDDLSDVSDLDDSIGCHSDEEEEKKDEEEPMPERVSPKPTEVDIKKITEKTSRTEEGEEQLDFEAEDGECQDQDNAKETDETDGIAQRTEPGDDQSSKKEEKDELEEGEVTDEDEARPEETEPRPVCRFFSRGQCTWGASCRFLHPGVTDKGNYTMFELIRPVVPGEYGREDRMYRPEPPMVESAWERGLRTAKEMLRKSMKRKEQDIDFEEKKMNLSLAQEEFDKENGYYARAPSPEPRYVVRHPAPAEYQPIARPPPEEYYPRRQVLYDSEYPVAPRERVRPSYRELPSHRMPDFYNNKYQDEPGESSSKVRRPKREVIVQKVPEERQPGRGDEWSDPWMRSKSPGARKGRKRSYSSGSSYSSSSSSRSTSRSSRTSYSSRSRSRHRRESRSHRGRQAVSPSVIVSERKAANERAALMNPPAPKKRALSPGMMRAGAQNPPAPPASKVDQLGRTRSKLAIAAALARVKGRRRSSRSSSDSSGTSSSDSDSSGSSSSTSRDGSPPPRRVDLAMALKAQAIDALKGGAEKKQIKLNLKNPVSLRKPDGADRKLEAKKRPAPPSPPGGDGKLGSAKKATSRREELLKQLKAVEDAIAKKRSKVN